MYKVTSKTTMAMHLQNDIWDDCRNRQITISHYKFLRDCTTWVNTHTHTDQSYYYLSQLS